MPRLGQARGPGAVATWSITSMSNIKDPCTKLIGGEGGPGGGSGAENGSLGNYPIFIISQNQNTLNISSF